MYSRDKNARDGFRHYCKLCCNIWHANNKEARQVYSKLYRDANREQLRLKDKARYPSRKARLQVTSNNRYQRNKKDIIRKNVIRNRERRHEDPSYRLECNLRRRIHNALCGMDKSSRTLELLGCPIEALRAWFSYQFEEGMNWDNYGMHGWHMDHIKPCAAFDLTDLEEQKKCFHWTNLQPLWAKDNLSKGAKHV